MFKILDNKKFRNYFITTLFVLICFNIGISFFNITNFLTVTLSNLVFMIVFSTVMTSATFFRAKLVDDINFAKYFNIVVYLIALFFFYRFNKCILLNKHIVFSSISYISTFTISYLTMVIWGYYYFKMSSERILK